MRNEVKVYTFDGAGQTGRGRDVERLCKARAANIFQVKRPPAFSTTRSAAVPLMIIIYCSSYKHTYTHIIYKYIYRIYRRRLSFCYFVRGFFDFERGAKEPEGNHASSMIILFTCKHNLIFPTRIQYT